MQNLAAEGEASNASRLQAMYEFLRTVVKAHDTFGSALTLAVDTFRKRLASDPDRDGKKVGLVNVADELSRNVELDARAHRDLAQALSFKVLADLDDFCQTRREALAKLLLQRSGLQSALRTARDECKQALDTVAQQSNTPAKLGKAALNACLLTAIATNEMICEYRRVVLPTINNDIAEIESLAGTLFLDANDAYCSSAAELAEASRPRHESLRKAKMLREIRKSLDDSTAASDSITLELVPIQGGTECEVVHDEETATQLAAKLEVLQLEARNLAATVKRKQEACERLKEPKQASCDSRRPTPADPHSVDARFELHQAVLKLARVRIQIGAIESAREGGGPTLGDGGDWTGTAPQHNGSGSGSGSGSSRQSSGGAAARNNPPIVVVESSDMPMLKRSKSNLKVLWSKAVRALKPSSDDGDRSQSQSNHAQEDRMTAEERTRQDEVYETLLSANMLAQRNLVRNASQTSGGSTSSNSINAQSVSDPTVVSPYAGTKAARNKRVGASSGSASSSSGMYSTTSNGAQNVDRLLLDEPDEEVVGARKLSNASRKVTTAGNTKNKFSSRKTYSMDDDEDSDR